MYVILGAGGPSAHALTAELLAHQKTVRLVSRKPIAVSNPTLSWVQADLLNEAQVCEAAKGATVVYLCAGIIYDAKIWQQQWPLIMNNVINAVKSVGARLIFLDNIYMYGLVNGPVTEQTPYHPCSVKGEIRASVANSLMDEVSTGNIQASIARAADFYGASSMNSFIDMMVLDKYSKNQSAQWVGNPKMLHNFSYIPDVGKGLYMLGQEPKSDNQIWHLPTAKPITGIEFMRLAAEIYQVQPKYTTINKLMLRLFGLFKKVVAGTVEMYYQYDHDYQFDSSKFEQYFNVKPTNYVDGITNISETMYKKQNI
ncbi:NAD-dependent epimerase/dehydratase family protein [Pedobacter sp. GR22-10]|uniref:NAD-dependent epimerase/dehydratase family protein n=1 Tax=Pedobacter sp. GR22-10 TaxID=2994472 RepID=UPI00224842FA|nr:NAD-dependent epimerase/dehydratase family protein [Pedobacter sp. GR22-10]MCX2431232.1 NAD-dependent epimerase/dehydratase family protein [Pedobacter sp. GR22-10]